MIEPGRNAPLVRPPVTPVLMSPDRPQTYRKVQAMDRITRADVERAASAFRSAMIRTGVADDTVTVQLHTGSKTNGNSWRIRLGGGGTPIGGDRLGWTAREAYDNLTHRTSMLYDIAGAREGRGPREVPAVLREILRGVEEITTADHAIVIRYGRPTERDDARGLLVNQRERMLAEVTK